MLTVKWMLLCDFASVSVGNKVNLLGVFDELQAQTLPLDIPQMFVVLNLVVEGSTNGFLKIRVAKDKLTLFESAPSHIRAVGRGTKPAGMTISVRDLSLPDFGAYRVQVYFDDKVIHTELLTLVE